MDGGTGHAGTALPPYIADESALPDAPMLGQWETVSKPEKSAYMQHNASQSKSTSVSPPAPVLGEWSTVPTPTPTNCMLENQKHAENDHNAMPNKKIDYDLMDDKSAVPNDVINAMATNASDASNGTAPPEDIEETNQMIIEPPASEPTRFDFGSHFLLLTKMHANE